MSIQKVLHRPKHKISQKKVRFQELSVCPADGAGWCPYPFSPEQLARRLKLKNEMSEQLSTAKVVTAHK